MKIWKVNVIREVEFQRINNLNNWKRTWKNLQGQGSIPSQVWIHIFSCSFLNSLGLSFIQLYNSYYSFWIIVAWISLEEIRAKLMWKLLYATCTSLSILLWSIGWIKKSIDFQLHENFIFIISTSKVFYIRFVPASGIEMKIHTNDLKCYWSENQSTVKND